MYKIALGMYYIDISLPQLEGVTQSAVIAKEKADNTRLSRRRIIDFVALRHMTSLLLQALDQFKDRPIGIVQRGDRF